MKVDSTIRIISTNIYKRDAIGNFCHDLYQVFHRAGYPVALYAARFDEDESDKIFSQSQFLKEINDNDIIIYHHSIFDELLEEIVKSTATKIFYYHGITPPDLLQASSPQLARECEKGLNQLNRLAKHFDFYCANSAWNAKQLQHEIDEDKIITILPPLCSSNSKFRSYEKLRVLREAQKNSAEVLLSVGQVAPHKKVDETIRLFNTYCDLYPESSLALKIVGNVHQDYFQAVCQPLIKASLHQDRISCYGFISDEQLQQLYLEASVYILMSEHEGFAVPLLEAMTMGLPIMVNAMNETAVAEVLNGAGCELHSYDHHVNALKLHELLTNDADREKLITEECARSKVLRDACSAQVFINYIKEIRSQIGCPHA